ncbi:hypothetical protein ATN88_15750 [Enterovibrio coralii]|uniref:Uncharacterized protein n=2 Tax=Enterovibrio coralii TaxID=294935 RepID=A0A135I5Z7_9GAMM|nr:hypothetical protein ATN88_15750 [Enterovibrio coralii]
MNRQEKVQVEISVETLESLFLRGELCAAKLNCLNAESKHIVQTLCLHACAKRFCQPEEAAMALKITEHFTVRKETTH